MEDTPNKKNLGYLRSLGDRITQPIDASSLGLFRFLFGILMLWSSLKYFYLGWVKQIYVGRKFHFTFDWFPWLSPLPGDGMYYLYGLMSISALFLAFGSLYRLSAVVFLFCYTYTFLLGLTDYNNHYYFICLLAFLFCFIDADRWMSLDSLWKRKARTEPTSAMIPYWNVLLIKSQIIIVYFYGGIAKINFDWLNGEPMRHWLLKIAEKESTPSVIASFYNSEIAPYFFSYGGLIFDITIGFILIFRKTRFFGIALLLIFNITNNWLFEIGIFPFLMIAGTVIFLEPDTPRKIFQKLFPSRKQQNFPEIPPHFRHQQSAIIFVCIYLSIQVLLPFRHWLYEGNVSWTEEGRMFAWQMKTRDKGDCRLRFIATDPESKETWALSAENHLTLKQFYKMCKHPQMIIQYAHYLTDDLKKKGISDPIITARTLVSFNYRPPQPLIAPNVNLAKESYSTFSHASWIMPLKN
ncbi:MAG: HTTM domain-containing protein [Nitrospinales bacterium]